MAYTRIRGTRMMNNNGDGHALVMSTSKGVAYPRPFVDIDEASCDLQCNHDEVAVYNQTISSN